MIERDTTTGATTINVGDRDVLIGMTGLKEVVRVWFAPLPENHGLTMNVAEPRSNTAPPENAAVVIYFTNRAALAAYLDTLTDLMCEVFG